MFFTQITMTVLFCYIVSSFILIFFFVNYWKNDIFGKLENECRQLNRTVAAFDNDADLLHVISDAAKSVITDSRTKIVITDSDGTILLKLNAQNSEIKEYYLSNGGVNSALMESVKSAGDFGFSYEGQMDEFGSESIFLYSVPIRRYEYHTFVYQLTNDAYQPYTTVFVRMILFTGFIAVLISFFASIAISYRMSRPIKKLTSATKQYASGDFKVKIPDMHSYDELETLIDSVNSMADSLSVLEESRSNFVANVSHELKTPMTIISGFIDGILDGTISENEREKYLQIVSDEVKRLSRLVIAMLNMSKIEAGKLKLNPSEVNMQRLIFSVLLSFEKAINEKDIEILGLDTLENIILEADEALINQIVYNLVDNAVKFTPRSGSITFSLYAEKKTANILIRNTGDGIPTEEAALIFDRFYKVDKSRRLDSHSFGMGLYIVKNIVELHGGTVSVDSVPGEFTEFHIKLPGII